MLKQIALILLASPLLQAAPPQVAVAQDPARLTIQAARPGMRLQLFDGTEPIGAVTSDRSGKAQFSLTSLAPGNHTIRSIERGTGKNAAAPMHVHVRASQSHGFSPIHTYAGVSRPAAMAIQDVDGDGYTDVVLAGNSSVAILFNKRGAFESPVTVANIAEPTGILAVDLDGDGIDDLAVSSAAGVAVMLGRGQGRFSSPQYWAAGASPSAIESADFNQDGVPDLAVTNRDGNTVSILLGVGNGAFRPAFTAEVGRSPRSLVIADFDGDGTADLATANFGDDSITVLFGNGDGTFRKGTAVSLNGPALSLRRADFDEDGRADLAVLTQNGSHILLNNGAGTFRAGNLTAENCSSMAVGDFNGDGHADLLLQTASGMRLRLGSGNGGFTDGDATASIAPGSLIALADLDGDGRLDLTAVEPSGTLAVFSGTSSSSGPAESTDSTVPNVGVVANLGGATPSSVVLASSANPASISTLLTLTATVTPSAATGSVTFFDRTDIVGRIVVTGGQAVLHTQLGAGSHALKAFYTGSVTYAASTSPVLTESVTAVAEHGFQTPVVYTASNFKPRSLATGDFNGDGKPDFVVGNNQGPVQIYLNNGSGGFTSTNLGPTLKTTGVSTGDFNGDGQIDLAVANWVNTTTGRVRIYLGNGDGTFQPPVDYGVGVNPYHIAIGDLNNDGIPDLVTPNNSNTISVLIGNGNGTFQTAVNYPTTGDLAYFAAIADFDGDGNADVIVTNNNSDSMTLFLGKGDGTFKTPVNIVCRVEPFGLLVADFNGDGKMDVVVTSAHQFTLGMFLGKGDGTFQAPVYYATGSEPHYLGASDFNGDGKLDIVVTDFLESAISLLPGNGDGTFQPTQTYYLTPATGAPHEMALADFNGDGAIDIVAADFNDSTVVVRFGNTSPTNPDVPMPNVFGMTQAQATTALQAVGLSLGTTHTIPNPAAAGTVIDYLEVAGTTLTGAPNPGTFLPAGTAVQLMLSSGPGTVDVYPILEQTVATATILLQEAGTVLGTVTSASDPVIEAGNIISQNPPPFTNQNPPVPITTSTGSSVNVVVSTGRVGSTVHVPDVAGLSQAVASYAIQQAGLVVGTVTTASSNTVAAGSVISENPSAGAAANGGSAVSFVVSTGAAPVPVPNVVGQTQAAATTTIQSAGLVVGTVTIASSGTVAAGNVISENPAAATMVSFGSSVNLVISSGTGPAVNIASFHVGNFTAGQRSAAYTLTVSNSAGSPPVNGTTVTVAETLPPGMTLVSMAGPGWTCNTTCTRADTLPGGASYPPITVLVNVASNASSPQVNSASVTLTGSPTGIAADSTTIMPAFTDVFPTDFFFDAVNLMHEYSITAGCGVNLYCPNDNVTRAQMAIFIVRAILKTDTFPYSPTPHFTDVPVGAFGFQWIQKMSELGITAGCGVNLYCPDGFVTRDQMAVFVIRARFGAAADSTFTYPPTPSFTDVNAGNLFFKWVQRMLLEGITAGCGVNLYCPGDPVTRGQMAIFIMRGGFNLLLAAGAPVISTISPTTASAGAPVTVTVTGANTHFVQGTTQVDAGPGVAVSNITVTSPTTLTVQVTVAPNPTIPVRTILVTTGSEQAVLPNGLTIN